MRNVINAPETGQNNDIDTSLGWLFLVPKVSWLSQLMNA
jgi:hypothetical protein